MILGYDGDRIGCAWRPTWVPTPHIDALANSGVRCTDGYVSAPYCSPSRAGFLTGRYQTQFGHEFNPHDGNDEAKLGLPLDQRTLANDLHDAGYRTALAQSASGTRGSTLRISRNRGVSTNSSAFWSACTTSSLRQDRQAGFYGSRLFAELDLSRSRTGKSKWLSDRSVNRRSDRLCRSPANGRKPWFLYSGLQRGAHAAGNHSSSIRTASPRVSPIPLGVVIFRCSWASTTAWAG